MELYINKDGDCDDCILDSLTDDGDPHDCIQFGVLIARALESSNKSMECCISIKKDGIDG